MESSSSRDARAGGNGIALLLPIFRPMCAFSRQRMEDIRWPRWRSAIWTPPCNCWPTGRNTLRAPAERRLPCVADGKKDMLCRASTGSNAPELGALLSTEFGLSGESVRTRQPLRCDDAERDARVNREVCRQLGIASVVVMPVVNDDEVLGVFELFSGKVNAFGERDLSAVQRLSEMVETAVRLAQAAENLPEQLRMNEISAPEVENEVENPGAPQDQVMTAEVLEDLVLDETRRSGHSRRGFLSDTPCCHGVQRPIFRCQHSGRRNGKPIAGNGNAEAGGRYAVAAELHQAQTEKVEARRKKRKTLVAQSSGCRGKHRSAGAVRVRSPAVNVPMQLSVRLSPEAESRKLAAETLAGLNQAQEDLLGKIEAAQMGSQKARGRRVPPF